MNIIQPEYQNYKSNIEMNEYYTTPNHIHEIIPPVGAPLVGALNGNVIPNKKMAHTNIRAPLVGALN